MYKKPSIVVVDYGMGNLFSVKLACEKVGLRAVISSDPLKISKASALILPGVGAFGDAMENLKKMDLVNSIKKFINSGKPFLGICLGMQLLMTESEEFGLHKGLDVIKGKVFRFPSGSEKVPQVGWNQIKKSRNIKWEKTLLNNLTDRSYMYFVHSFYCIPESKDTCLAETEYAGVRYCSGLQKDNIVAFQFHPEKSGEKGLMIYKNLYHLI